ncbi:hypothetical protein SAMN04488030_2185 [Aliiroseovarius halocynthiae]|uniref:VOC family protein n=1 Tax=Aliiroseovarius halocynthiae TaxID=985055 RepID=A0A545SXT3_9RHOB|nr:VOC family protein [Aliiroseovarius halocynthiae]TQV69776.1 VOC family protein [Aliiroseovarius halocynthiae]SMR81764.1 hypothetical protein SAMN04488030_2185 [Aliiroseovarius halocynthiae]
MAHPQYTQLVPGRVAAIIPVSDITIASAAYRSIFGLKQTFQNGDPVGYMILEGGAAELHLSLQPDHNAPKFNVAHMLVSDAAQAHKACEAQGFRIIKALKDQDYGLRSFVFADHDGNRIDVGQTL